MGDSKFASAKEEREVTDLLDRLAANTAQNMGEGIGLDLLCYLAHDSD